MLEQLSKLCKYICEYICGRQEHIYERQKNQNDARKELIQRCWTYVSGPVPFYRNKDFMDKYYPKIRRYLSEQLVQKIEGGKPIFNLPCESMQESHGKTVEVKDQITEKFKNELAELERTWKFI